MIRVQKECIAHGKKSETKTKLTGETLTLIIIRISPDCGATSLPQHLNCSNRTDTLKSYNAAKLKRHSPRMTI